jgi:hypothetical protein
MLEIPGKQRRALCFAGARGNERIMDCPACDGSITGFLQNVPVFFGG